MIIFSILKIHVNILYNYLTKLDSALKVLSVFFFLLVFLDYSQTTEFITDYVLGNYNLYDKQFYKIANLIFFAIFLFHIFSLFFFGPGNLLGTQLKFFPISSIKIVIYEILVDVVNVINIFFVGLYFSTYFIFHESFEITTFLIFVPVFLLYMILISNTTLFLKYIILNYFLTSRIKKIFYSAVSLLFFISFLLYTNYLNFDEVDILSFSSITNYLPSGVFLLYHFSNSLFSPFTLKILMYFIISNSVLLKFNYMFFEKFSKSNYSLNIRPNKPKFSLLFFDKPKIFNHFHKKELLYHLRSYKMMVSFSILSLLYILLIIVLISNDHLKNNKDITFEIKQLFILFHFIIIITFSGNLFRFGSQDLKAYLSMPVMPSEIINSKLIITYIWLVINFISLNICLLYSEITFLNYLVFLSALVVVFYLFNYASIFFSIYFPKKVNMSVVNGLNVSLITFIIFIPFMLICYMLLQYILNSRVLFVKAVVIFLGIVLPIFLHKLQITKTLANLFIHRKTKLLKM